jgi:hypothetical protein
VIILLRRMACEAILEEDRELIHCQLPFSGFTAQVGGDVAQRLPDELGGIVVAGEVPTRSENTNGPLRRYVPKGTDLIKLVPPNLQLQPLPSVLDFAGHSAAVYQLKYSMRCYASHREAVLR